MTSESLPPAHGIVPKAFAQAIQCEGKALHTFLFLALGWIEIKQRQLLLGRRKGFGAKRHSANADPPLEAT